MTMDEITANAIIKATAFQWGKLAQPIELAMIKEAGRIVKNANRGLEYRQQYGIWEGKRIKYYPFGRAVY